MTGVGTSLQGCGTEGRTGLHESIHSVGLSFLFEETKMRNESRIRALSHQAGAHRQVVLLANFDTPDAKVRAKFANLLSEDGPMGYPAIPALTKALGDGEGRSARERPLEALGKIDVEVSEGGIIRGPKKEKKIALEFTGHILRRERGNHP